MSPAGTCNNARRYRVIDLLKRFYETLNSTEAAVATATFLAAVIPIVLRIAALLKLDTTKLPRWAQPIPGFVLALAGALLEQLQSGSTIWDSVLVLAFGFLGGTGLYHTAKRVVPGLGKGQTASVTKTTSISLLLLVALTAGCAGSFEEARIAGLKSRAPTVTATPSSDQCLAYDSGHRTWDAVAKGAAVLAGAQGLGQIPVDTRSARIGLAVGTAVAATCAVAAESLASGYAESWARDCQ
jgi:hypothetical protein